MPDLAGGSGQWCRRSRRRPGGEAGITTTEVVIELMLVGVLAVVAVTSVGNALNASRVRGAAEQVASAMQAARQYAISNAATYTVTLSGTTVAVTCTADCPASPPGLPTTDIVNGATTTTPPSIRFGPIGTANPSGIVTVQYAGSTSWQVRVTASGRIRVCSPTCS